MTAFGSVGKRKLRTKSPSSFCLLGLSLTLFFDRSFLLEKDVHLGRVVDAIFYYQTPPQTHSLSRSLTFGWSLHSEFQI